FFQAEDGIRDDLVTGVQTCALPISSKEQIKEIVELQRKAGKTYMMMETVVYSREYLFAKDLYDRGVLGRIQFLRGSHQQDMDGRSEERRVGKEGGWEGGPGDCATKG